MTTGSDREGEDRSDAPLVAAADAFGARRTAVGTLVALVAVMLAVGVLPSLTCTDARRAREILIDAGYREVKAGGFHWGACGNDRYATDFSGVSPAGARVHGAVCCRSGDCRILEEP